MPLAQVVGGTMAPAEEEPDPEVEAIEEVVPARAVLTELARGFLLAQASNPERAVRFAEGFLREQVGRTPADRTEPASRVTLARRSLGRGYRGAIEPDRPR